MAQATCPGVVDSFPIYNHPIAHSATEIPIGTRGQLMRAQFMLVEYEEGIAYRRGIERIHRDATNTDDASWGDRTILVLG